MMNFDLDPTQPLFDKYWSPGGWVRKPEEPILACSCEDGLLDGSWVYRRKPKCTCEKATDDFVNTLHSPECDSVPCPFCSLEATP